MADKITFNNMAFNKQINCEFKCCEIDINVFNKNENKFKLISNSKCDRESVTYTKHSQSRRLMSIKHAYSTLDLQNIWSKPKSIFICLFFNMYIFNTHHSFCEFE